MMKKDEVDNEGNLKETLEVEFNNINEQIFEKEEQRKQFAPQYEEVKRKEKEISSRLDCLDQRRRELYASLCRKSSVINDCKEKLTKVI